MFQNIWQFAIDHHQPLSALAGLGASVTALIAIMLSVYSLLTHRKYNRLSVRPVGGISYVDFSGELSIWIKNVGAGPMKIESVTVACRNEKIVTETLIKLMEKKEVVGNWTNFSGNLNGRFLGIGDVQHLLKLKGDPSDHDFLQLREATRKALLSVEIKVTYSDIYGMTIGTVSRKLSWFGRHYHKFDFDTGELIID